MPSPRISICIPTYDRVPYLREAVASARAQTLREIEIVIGDDGNSSDLRTWCLFQAAEDERVRYEKTPGRLRLAGNWNFLAGLARGEYATFMGDDDRLLPTFSERLLAAAEGQQHQIDVVFSNHYIIDGSGARSIDETYATTRQYRRASLKAGVVEDVQGLVWGNSVPMSASIVRTQAVRRLGFKHDINTPELELFVRMAAEGSRFAFVDDYLAEYRVHSGSETSAGLTIDRLAEYLQDVDAEGAAEPAKRALLSRLMVSGVNVRLKRGDVAGARSLRGSRYYPLAATSAHIWAQRLILALPDMFALPAYSSMRRVGMTAQRIRAMSRALLKFEE
jgi:glycosyltransferase involved in cell wall biosynthesis